MTEEARFAFGKNWQSFLAELDEERIAQAVRSLQQLLGLETLEGKRFLDLGCGSGLFSLAAQRLGADVISIDYDKFSVACSEELRKRFGSESLQWDIKQGSVLDSVLMQGLGRADVVYSWGVLHHTGDMDKAISMAADRTKYDGLFCLAIYNDQGGGSRRWLRIKKIYNALPTWLRFFWVLGVGGVYECKFALARLACFRNPLPFRDWHAKRQDRGMSVWHDWVDWIGGLPFEVAKPEEIIVPLRQRGFVLENMRTVASGWGCNEFVFSKAQT
ncbi:MAG: SAM-dependent methyltransferase [Rhodopirellula sp.]|nr:SAM-dependent methyltransferase [Rhodopirellula sp.]MAI73302.1 SAM-dependent methyltransferase [Rhodopirellula sp.]OUX50376.1 MAG: SAM-dependent methyltransferase [Rhodopirellula sp. TMED283]